MATGAKANEGLKVPKLFDVSHLTAVVTGGGTGIGLMITQALVSNGAKVYITGRRQEALQRVVSEYSTGPGKIIALPGDITQKDDLKRLADKVASKESNGIHLLVNNGKLVPYVPYVYLYCFRHLSHRVGDISLCPGAIKEMTLFPIMYVMSASL